MDPTNPKEFNKETRKNMAAALRGEKASSTKKVPEPTGLRGWQLAVAEAKLNGETPPTYEQWAKRGF